MNYAAKISYLGKNYSGWQVQPDALSVQEIIEGVLAKIEGEQVRITGAGRTDKGVNAWGQVASFKLTKYFEPDKLRLAINFLTKIYDLISNKNHMVKTHCNEFRMTFGENITMFTTLITIISDMPLNREIIFHNRLKE